MTKANDHDGSKPLIIKTLPDETKRLVELGFAAADAPKATMSQQTRDNHRAWVSMEYELEEFLGSVTDESIAAAFYPSGSPKADMKEYDILGACALW